MSLIESLDFKDLGKVHRESSRGLSNRNDLRRDSLRKDDMFTGMNSFVDSDVRMGNSYVYRIRSFTVNDRSEWVYRGSRVGDEIFEKKLRDILTFDERNHLSKTSVPLKIPGTKVRQ